MRTVILTAALAAVALTAPRAAAQFEAQANTAKKMKAESQGSVRDDGESSGEEGSEEGGESEGSPMEGQVELKQPAGEGADSAPGQVHTVEKGDTLWDLSQRYLGSPWYWPKVWSYNPEIANPHWIYPGNRVKFAGGGEEAPTQVEVGNAADQAAEVEPGEMLPDEGSKVQVVGKIGYTPKSAATVRLPGFVTAAQVEETGTITGAFGQMEMLSYPETAYVRFKKNAQGAKSGDNYVVYRPVGDVKHPETGERVGYLTDILGVVRVVKTHDDRKGEKDEGQLVTVQVMRSYDDIRRGDFIGPYSEPLVRSVAPRANDKNLEALIVGNAVPYLTIYGEHHLVIIDKGSNDGVQPGNTFTVVRQQDGIVADSVVNPSVRMAEMPKEDVGACMAFDVKTTASLCLITRNIRELVTGDHLEMRSAGASAPRAER